MSIKDCTTATVLLALAATVTTGVGVASADPVSDCPTAMNFVVGGTGDPDGGMIEQVPDGERTDIHYPASIAPVAGWVGGDDSVHIAETGLDAAVRDFRAGCPDAQVNLVGHSLGAVAVSNVCDRYQVDLTMQSGTSCYTTGNPKRRSVDGKGGIMGQWPTFAPGFAFTGERGEPGPVPVYETCGTWDGICNAPNPFVDPVGTIKAAIGYATGSHVYSDDPIPATPGDNLVEAETILTRLIPDAPVPDLDVATAHEALEPVAQALVPDHAIDIGAPYEPTPIGEYLPPIARDNIPVEWSSVVLPPIPTIALPKLVIR